MSTIDTTGNIHRPAGAPGGGQFAGRVNTAPAQGLSADATAAATTIRTWHSRETLHTAADNWMISDFEAEHPAAAVEDYRDWLMEVPEEFHDDGARDYGSEERRGAVRTISARMAAGQAGVLVETGSLRKGDRVDLSRLWSSDHYPKPIADFAARGFGVIASDATETAQGETIVSLSNFDHPIVVPNGTALPVQGVSFRGQQMTERELVRRLLSDGELAPAARDMAPREAIDQYIAANALDSADADYPEVLL